MNKEQLVEDILSVEKLHQDKSLDRDGENLFGLFREKLLGILKNYNGVEEEMTDDQVQKHQAQKEVTSEEIREGILKLNLADVDIKNPVIKSLTQIVSKIKNHHINKAA